MMTKSKTRAMVLTAVLAAVLVVMAQIILPIGPIPFSMALFGVFLAGAMLPPVYAFACMGVYLFLGLVGLPVFSGFRGGPQVLFGPTGGYLTGYYAIAVAVALVVKYTDKLLLQFLSALAGLALCYLFGTLWFVFSTKTSFVNALFLCVVPFAVPDCIKAVLALVLARILYKRMKPVQVIPGPKEEKSEQHRN